MFQAQAAGEVVQRPGMQAVGRALSFFIPAERLAVMMTKEPWLKLLTSAAKTPIWAKQAPSILLKLQILKFQTKMDDYFCKNPQIQVQSLNCLILPIQFQLC